MLKSKESEEEMWEEGAFSRSEAQKLYELQPLSPKPPPSDSMVEIVIDTVFLGVTRRFVHRSLGLVWAGLPTVLETYENTVKHSHEVEFSVEMSIKSIFTD